MSLSQVFLTDQYANNIQSKKATGIDNKTVPTLVWLRRSPASPPTKRPGAFLVVVRWLQLSARSIPSYLTYYLYSPVDLCACSKVRLILIGLDQPKPHRTGGIDRPDGPLEKPADVNLLRSSTTYSVGHRQPQIKNKTREHTTREAMVF